MIEGVSVVFKFIDFTLVKIDENGTAFVSLSLFLEEGEFAIGGDLIECVFCLESVPEVMADASACLSDIDVHDISHIAL